MGKISLIIPVFNSEKYLPHLFDALNKCTFFDGDEVLFVDNGSTDESKKLCMKQSEERPNVYHCLEFVEKAGSYAARNYAVQLAKGDILVFTDSDCKPVPGWLDAIRNNIKRGEVIAGKVQIEIEKNGLWERFDSIAHLNSEKNARGNRVATANMATYKEDFFKVGSFEERFSGGDYGWSISAAKKGIKINFIPEALVYHPSRKTFKEILKKEQRIAFGAGNHHKYMNKLYITLIVKYVLKIFKLDTNVKYTNQLRKAGIRKRDLIEFNHKFMKIRIEQLKFASRGYRQLDVRKLGIK